MIILTSTILASATNAPGSEQQVLALQSFPIESQQREIQELCQKVFGVEGVKCAFKIGAVPHMTIGSWNVTQTQREEARAVFSKRLASMETIEFQVQLAKVKEDGLCEYYLVPAEPTNSLKRCHKQIHDALGYDYKTYRSVDLPGQWWPHISLFAIEPGLQSGPVEEHVSELKKISTIRIDGLGLVTFPIQTIEEVRF